MGLQLSTIRNPWRGQIPATPFYLYSETVLAELFEAFKAGLASATRELPVHIHFAMKANRNPHILTRFREWGAGVDIVSGGELAAARARGFDPKHIVFSGVGKTDAELREAATSGLALVNIESASELTRLAKIAATLSQPVKVAFRVNPDVDAKTHPYISTGLRAHKFGVDFEEGRRLYLQAARTPGIVPEALSLHIGSQLLDLGALDEALGKALDFARSLKSEGVSLRGLDVGGGLGVDYKTPRQSPPFEAYGRVLQKAAVAWKKLQGPHSYLCTECGRALVAQAGFLVTRVIGLKDQGDKHFAIVDASMSELLRPALYQAWHPVSWEPDWNASRISSVKRTYDLAGPVCESADILAQGRELPELHEGDVLAIGCAGAYGYVMASHYNARPLPAEWWMPAMGSVELSTPVREAP